MDASAEREIAFVVETRDDLSGVFEVVPAVDGEPLTALIHAFELGNGYGPPDSYGGLIPSFYRFGSLDAHFLGLSEPWLGSGVPLLGCSCGEWGCWPLLADVSTTDNTITWHDFEQPYRKDRDYEGFGPFLFSTAQFSDALSMLMTHLQEPDE